MVLQATNLTRVYSNERGGSLHRALDAFHLTVERGEFVGVMGPSGSGKTTLLQLLGTMDQPTYGEVRFGGKSLSGLSLDQLREFRRRHLGFIFQEFHLLHSLTLRENIMLPLILETAVPEEVDERVHTVASQLGIEEILNKHPYEVSGGQQQRAAAARALVHRPDLVLADEPTGNLDSRSARTLMESLEKMNQTEKATILMVTHDAVSASYCKRILFIKDGKLWTEIHQGEERRAFYRRILTVVSALGGETLGFLDSGI